jgi:hypothetical protein
MKRVIFLILLPLCLFMLTACKTGYHTESSSGMIEYSESKVDLSQSETMIQDAQSNILLEEGENVKIQITVGDTVLTAVPEENSSAKALIALLQKGPITVQMSDYAGMEKVGSLGTNLPRNDTQISVDAGDVILYQGNQITIYYGTNSWNFTKLAVIEDATKESLLKVLGSGDVDVTFSIAE